MLIVNFHKFFIRSYTFFKVANLKQKFIFFAMCTTMCKEIIVLLA